jgi:hypothetical protein
MRKIRFYLYFNRGYVTLLTYTAGHWPVVYASWHTHQDNGLLCMQFAYTTARPMDGLLCMPIGIHNNQANGLLCMPIGIHNNLLAYTTCQLAYTTSHPLARCVCQLAYTTTHWPGYCVCQLGYCVCQFAYTTTHWPGLLCILIGLLCIPIGIHRSPLAWLLCMP